MHWDKTVDLLVVGSGAGSVPAALRARQAGSSVLVIEKLPAIGGSTAYSGGVAWLPCAPQTARAGGCDSFAKARCYLDNLLGPPTPGSSARKRDLFVEHSPLLIAFLERHGMRFEHAAWPDYYTEVEGALDEGRSLVAPGFPLERLGTWQQRFAGHPVYRHFPLGAHEGLLKLALARTSWRGRLMAARVLGRILLENLTSRQVRYSGQALQGRLLAIARNADIPFWSETPCDRLLAEDGRIVGAEVRLQGNPFRIRARQGVLLNAGGFSHDTAMREKYLPPPASARYTQASPGDTGEMIREAICHGAAIDQMDTVIYVAGSLLPDGSVNGFHQPGETGKPHCVVVDQDGGRFANEAISYMEFGQRMYRSGVTQAWAIIESRHRNRYTWGLQMPGSTPAAWFANGYMHKADTLAELATRCGLPPANLEATIRRFNQFAATGSDEDFARGSSFYQRTWGDAGAGTLNPTLGEISRPPFYAVRLQPLDVGTVGGLVTNEHAQVLRQDGSPIAGLYATGNCSASLFKHCYPGAGASIGAAMVFGYIAAGHACGHPDRP